MKRLLLALLLLGSPAFAQSVQQSGNVTAGHVPWWVTSGVIGDAGSSADSTITSLGVTNNGGAGFCVSSARQSAAGRNQLCFGAQTSGAATISLQNFGTAAPQALNFVVNGASASFPTPTSPLAVNSGGTGATTGAGAQTNLGLGTMAVQNANAVAITGGTVTGLPNPTNPPDAATKAYTDGLAAGLTIVAPSRLATAAVLPNTPTYSNGASGVGATLTAGSNSTLTVDGTVANLNDVVLVNNQAAPAQNGIYTVTTAGGGVPWVLTRATYFNQASNMLKGTYTFISGGSANINTSWVLSATVTTVGTTAVVFNQFSSINSPGGTSGQIQFNNSNAFGGFTASGDATINTGTGAVAVTKTGGVAFAPSATTDTTNASNIASGTLGSGRLPSPFTSGTASGNTSKFATTTGTLTTGHCTSIDASGNFIDSGGTCGGVVGTPWVVYGFTAVTGSATVNNPTPNTNGLTGEVASLPYTVPGGKTLVITAYGVQAADAAGTVVNVPFIGGGGTLANATALPSAGAQAGTAQINGTFSIPAGGIFNIAIINGQATGTFGWFASGTLQ